MSIYNQTPTQQDLFSRMMAEKFHSSQSLNNNMAFMSFFGNSSAGGRSLFTNDALSVDIDVIKDNTTIAALTTRGSNPTLNNKNTQGQKASSTSRLFPISTGHGTITADQLYTRQLGENAYSPADKYSRYRQIAETIFTDKIRAQVWLFELMASESMLTGKMKVDEFGSKVDFGRNADNTVNAALPWTNASSTPLDDIDEICVLVDVNGNAEPDMVTLDVESYDAFIKHATVQAIADNKGYSIIFAGDRMYKEPEAKYARHIKAGWRPRAILTTKSGYQVWLFTYLGRYTDASGDRQGYMPQGTVMATSASARFDRYFGPSDKMPDQLSTNSVIEQSFGYSSEMVPGMSAGADSILDPRQFHFFAYGRGNNSAIDLEIQTAPIYACVQVDAVAVMKLTIT